MNGNERVILVNGDGSKWYEQAIFIIKRDTPKKSIPVDFVAEAERIIDSYMSRSIKGGAPVQMYAPAAAARVASPKAAVKHKAAKSSNFDLFLNAVMLIGCVALAVVLLWYRL